MTKSDFLVLALRAFLAALLAFTVLLQVMSLPGQFAHNAAQSPDYAYLSWSMLAVAELEVLLLQVVIVCTWRLLTMVKKDRIFSESSLPWVDRIVWSFAAGWILLAAFASYLTGVIFFTPQLRDPGVPILLFGILLIGAVFVLLVVVLRALLRQATTLQTDMEAVI